MVKPAIAFTAAAVATFGLVWWLKHRHDNRKRLQAAQASGRVR